MMNDQELMDRIAAANPVRVEDLGDTTERAEALRREILARRSRSRRWWVLVALPVAGAAVVFGLLRPESIPRQTLVTSGEAHAIMLAAAQRAEKAPASGRFWHTKGEVRHVFQRDHRGNRYALVATHAIEGWQPSDRRDGDGVSNWNAPRLTPLTADDAVAYRRDGSPQPNENPDPDMGVAVQDPPEGPELAGDAIYEGDARNLPHDPLKMRLAMLTWARDHGGLPDNPAVWLFREGADLLNAESQPLPRETRIAIYRMIGTLPGVRSLGTVKDPLGRPALAVAMTEKTETLGVLEWRLFLSPSRDLLMGTQAMIVKPGADTGRIAPGQALYTYSVRAAEWTDGCPPGRLPNAKRLCP
ncbi:hypothetical protein [Actinomadura rudentiformis]|uniref:CU044_5270 family protein n=1 Tax=Actinomadura rudentiformis TaxID=359158 RepID=A0A6H9YJ52_9ACTN|nr:hypothetical protein [Actinomadura rudentiformis]KAB2346853.1 hypothetical protein F8566_21805 [Actinomadura rudentiformis]